MLLLKIVGIVALVLFVLYVALRWLVVKAFQSDDPFKGKEAVSYVDAPVVKSKGFKQTARYRLRKKRNLGRRVLRFGSSRHRI